MDKKYKLNESEINSLALEYKEGVLSVRELMSKHKVTCRSLYLYLKMKGVDKKIERINIKIGEKYGSLTAISKSPDAFKNGRIVRYYKCRCDCGEERDFTTAFLMKSKKRKITCGCYTWNKKPFGEGTLTVILNGYKRGATLRGYDFKITKEMFRELTKGKCFYCGVEPSTYLYSQRQNGGYTYNGIDRVDNNKGYVIGNVVSCCKKCNFAKKSMDKINFINWVWNISNNTSKKEIIEYVGFDKIEGREKMSIVAWIKEYKKAAKKKNMPFELSDNDFLNIVKSNCYYCNKEPKINHSRDRRDKREYFYNGVDRKNNKLGYLKDNSVPCCTDCNLGKRTMEENEFINWAKTVNNNMALHG